LGGAAAAAWISRPAAVQFLIYAIPARPPVAAISSLHQ
jgi:hypothetical protein